MSLPDSPAAAPTDTLACPTVPWCDGPNHWRHHHGHGHDVADIAAVPAAFDISHLVDEDAIAPRYDLTVEAAVDDAQGALVAIRAEAP